MLFGVLMHNFLGWSVECANEEFVDLWEDLFEESQIITNYHVFPSMQAQLGCNNVVNICGLGSSRKCDRMVIRCAGNILVFDSLGLWKPKVLVGNQWEYGIAQVFSKVLSDSIPFGWVQNMVFPHLVRKIGLWWSLALLGWLIATLVLGGMGLLGIALGLHIRNGKP